MTPRIAALAGALLGSGRVHPAPAEPPRRWPSHAINALPVHERPVRFSVACNFDPELVGRVASFPVYEVFGKLTTDYFGGGRPSFYLPTVGKRELEGYVRQVHGQGIEFNYLLNASSMNNVEFTTKGQRELRLLLDWLSEAGVDTITVGNLFFLRLIKQRYPHFGVRVSSHRETDNPRKARFWEDNGADCIVISETTVHRELEVLHAMREAVKVDLSLIVNNWCRQDCAIASNHAVLLSNASRNGKQHFPLDYCSVYCNAYRVEEPVNYIRANWIRPEDLPRYRKLGYTNFKIVERNTPTELLALRVWAYARERYDGNLLDLVQNYAYPRSVFTKRDTEAFSLRRMAKYFFKPQEVNLLHFRQIVGFGKALSMLYPREADNPVYIDNRALDGFMERFETKGCESVDCETCRYCHQWAEKSVSFDPSWRKSMTAHFDGLLDELHGGSLWEPYLDTVKRLFRRPSGPPQAPRPIGTGGQAVPLLKERTVSGRAAAQSPTPCSRPRPAHHVSIGNLGPSPASVRARAEAPAEATTDGHACGDCHHVTTCGAPRPPSP
ncbi:MAG: U32 family peptidase [Archangiaceae bacterium]|nr:U32 family peptidase [Archangiaceae bacterium]